MDVEITMADVKLLLVQNPDLQPMLRKIALERTRDEAQTRQAEASAELAALKTPIPNGKVAKIPEKAKV